MHSRFFSSRSNDNVESPRRRLRLFSMNERPRKQGLSSTPLCIPNVAVVEPTSHSSDSDSSFSKDQPVNPTKENSRPAVKKTTSPPAPISHSSKRATERTAPLARRRAPPAPLLERNGSPPRSFSAPASKPGVSFQRNADNNADPIAAKMSTFDNNSRAQNCPAPILDPIAAKIAAHDNSRSSSSGSAVTAPHHQQQFRDDVTYMEIAPGQRVRLRGAKETWQCVENDFYLPTTCFSCDTDLCCIMDASYVLCPVCKVVSPVEGWAGGPDGGVGLGFTYTDLAKWQQEIVHRRQQAGF